MALNPHANLFLSPAMTSMHVQMTFVNLITDATTQRFLVMMEMLARPTLVMLVLVANTQTLMFQLMHQTFVLALIVIPLLVFEQIQWFADQQEVANVIQQMESVNVTLDW